MKYTSVHPDLCFILVFGCISPPLYISLEIFIIFISTIDIIKEGSAIYTIKNRVLEFPNSDIWNEKVTKIILYTKGKRGTLNDNIVNFLNYCCIYLRISTPTTVSR